MTVQEYNENFIPTYEGACCFIKNIDHAVAKCPDSDEVAMQLRCTGWNIGTENFITKALTVYKDLVLTNLEKSKTERKSNIRPIKFIDDDFIVMDGAKAVFYADEYLAYANRHNFNVKYTTPTSTDSVKVIKLFADAGFKVDFGVDKETTPDGVCTIEKIYVTFWHPKFNEIDTIE